MPLKTHGITKETVKHMILNAGTIYRDLAYNSETQEWEGTVLGATSGGITFNWEAQWLDIEVDGATVLVKGITKQKVGESAYIEGQMTEVTEEVLNMAMHFQESDSDDPSYSKFVSKNNITEEDDYYTNVAYVGTMSSGKQIIIILPNALCTEAFEINAQNATQTTFSVKFECTADFENNSLNQLDVEFYYPLETA